MELEVTMKKDVKSTQEHVQALYDFLSRHSRLCNAHAVGYFTEDHWEHVIEEEWRSQLLAVEDGSDWVTELRVPAGKRAREWCVCVGGGQSLGQVGFFIYMYMAMACASCKTT